MDKPKPEIPPQLQTNGVNKKESSISAIEIRSEEVQEIIGRPPHWLVRWGIASFFMVLVLIFLSASTIQYPETIQVPLKLTAINAPIIVEAKTSGKITRLFFEESDRVLEGEVLAWIESRADHESVITFSAVLDSLDFWLASQNLEKIKGIGELRINNLGSLQSSFQTFEQAYRTFLSYLPDNYYYNRKKILEEELVYTKKLSEHLETQKEIYQTRLELSQREFEAQKSLAEKGLVASLELDRAESELSNQKLPLQQTESSIINNLMSQSAKIKEIMELTREIEQQTSLFAQTIYSLKSVFDEWKYNHLLTAPVSGTLLYAGVFQEMQNVTSGQDIFIINTQSTEFFGELSIAQQSLGKIEEGQKVLVRFNAYPYSEYGSVQASIEYLSEIAVRDSLFFAKVEFPDGLQTNYGYKLSPKNGMTGSAEIITQDMRLIRRIYNNLTKDLN